MRYLQLVVCLYFAHSLVSIANETWRGYPSTHPCSWNPRLVQLSPTTLRRWYVRSLGDRGLTSPDEAVKEALASELVNIIWWFITHCQIAEDEGVSQSMEAAETTPQSREQYSTSNDADVTRLSVQAFTPILGTLLLSQNALVGTPARNAVVELLKRIWHADEREAGRPSYPLSEGEIPRLDYSTGHLQRRERRLFERELVHQVVIGMGRLDLPDADEGPLSTISTPRSVGEHHHNTSESCSLEYPMQTPPGPDTSTAGSTPLAAPAGNAQDSYFPAFSSIHPTPAPATSPTGHYLHGVTDERRSMEVVTPPTFQLNLPLPSPRREAGVNTPTRGITSPSRATPPASVVSLDMTLPSPVLSPSPPFAPVATIADATGLISSTSIESESSTPSLVSTSTSTDSSASLLTPSSSNSASATTETLIEVSGEAELDLTRPDAQPETDADKDVVMASEPVASPSRYQADVGREPTDSGDYFSQTEAPTAESRGTQLSAWLSAGLPEGGDVSMQDVSPQDIEAGIEEEGDIGEEAAMGRLSSMSLMAAVTASGTCHIFWVGSVDGPLWVVHEFPCGLTCVNIGVFLGGLKEETKNAFVTEVERVGRDPVYWVRREAAFAVGALAKVVPNEVVVSSLVRKFIDWNSRRGNDNCLSFRSSKLYIKTRHGTSGTQCYSLSLPSCRSFPLTVGAHWRSTSSSLWRRTTPLPFGQPFSNRWVK